MISDRSIRDALERFRVAVPSTDENRPSQFQVVLDASLSMTSGDGSKERLARELAILLLRSSDAADFTASVYALRGADRTRVLDRSDVARVNQIPFDGVATLLESWPTQLGKPDSNAWRLVISDFLFPGDPAPLIRRAADGTAKLWVLQLLDDWELNPSPAGPTALVDVETEQRTELSLDQPVIDGYVRRLTALRDSLASACQAVGASFRSLSSATELQQLCADWLVPSGLLVAKHGR